ncbi:MAG: DUF554 domain-containing protein [Firmicutes bacterium]|jgi:uncharacterized membrane protein YqgA involved in biofilm formation|nr:DUF554 domain-containing protein [Bacillota bacterium]
MTGTLINAILVVLGSLIGLALRKRLPERYGKTLMQGIALFVLFIGGQMATETAQPLIPLISLALGSILGEFLMIEDRLEAFSLQMERRFGRGDALFAQSFVGSSLLFVVGPMAIIGSINDGLQGDYSLLLAKSIMDGFSAIAFASTMGIGVLFSAITILVYQGGLTFAAIVARDFFTPAIIAEMTATGGMIILGLGINMLELRRIRVGNLLPAIPIAIVGTALTKALL